MSLTCGFASPHQSLAHKTAVQSEVVCVRGGIEPKSQCTLTSQFAISSHLLSR